MSDKYYFMSGKVSRNGVVFKMFNRLVRSEKGTPLEVYIEIRDEVEKTNGGEAVVEQFNRVT